MAYEVEQNSRATKTMKTRNTTASRRRETSQSDIVFITSSISEKEFFALSRLFME